MSRQTVLAVSSATCQRRSKRSSGRPKPCLCPVSSIKRSTVSLGGRSRVGTLWPAKIAPFNRTCIASLQSAWAPRSSSYAPVTSRCSPSRMLCWTSSATPRKPSRNRWRHNLGQPEPRDRKACHDLRKTACEAVFLFVLSPELAGTHLLAKLWIQPLLGRLEPFELLAVYEMIVVFKLLA